MLKISLFYSCFWISLQIHNWDKWCHLVSGKAFVYKRQNAIDNTQGIVERCRPFCSLCYLPSQYWYRMLDLFYLWDICAPDVHPRNLLLPITDSTFFVILSILFPKSPFFYLSRLLNFGKRLLLKTHHSFHLTTVKSVGFFSA